MRGLLVVLLLLVSVTFTGADQTDNVRGTPFDQIRVSPVTEKTKFKVSVFVDCDDNLLKNEMESYIKRELRTFGDVELAKVGDYMLSVNVMVGKYERSGTKTGYVFCSWLGEKLFNPRSLQSHCSASVLDVPNVYALTYAFPRYNTISINVPRAEVKQLCQRGVAGFDTRVLEPDRQKR